MSKQIKKGDGMQKGGNKGNQMWRSHRMEGVVKNRGIKAVRKSKKGSK